MVVFEKPELMVALIIWFVGYLFIMNGLNMCGKISNKESGVWNLLIGSWIFILAIIAIVNQTFGVDTWLIIGGPFLFSFTYLGLGFMNILNLDGRGVGWYCLMVAIIAPFIAQMYFSMGDWRFGIIWLIWAALWFVFFLTLGLQKTKIAGTKLGYIMILAGITTLSGPGYMMLRGWW